MVKDVFNTAISSDEINDIPRRIVEIETDDDHCDIRFYELDLDILRRGPL